MKRVGAVEGGAHERAEGGGYGLSMTLSNDARGRCVSM